MPIRETERDRYPADWPRIRAEILERAGDRCECDGRCDSPHCSASTRCVAWRESGVDDDRVSRCVARNREPHPSTGSRVVLTIAHLDHTPENCDPDNLRAMCQACHLSYDREHHAETRRRSRAGAHCRAGCATRDHATWGECVRAARIAVDRTALAAGRQ